MIRLLLLASIVAGEAQTCPADAQRAVVHVAINREALSWITNVTDGWNGRGEPSSEYVVRVVEALAEEDPTGGAVFMFGEGDVAGLRARNGGDLPSWLDGYEPGQRWTCDDGRWIETWRPSSGENHDDESL